MSDTIYQGTLLSFPELMKSFKYFDESPMVNGGYDERTPFISKRGRFKPEGKRVKDNGGNFVTSSGWTLWSTTPLLPGKFILFRDVVYRIMNDTDWAYQGGFYVYSLEERIGNSTLKQFRPVAELGGNEFT